MTHQEFSTSGNTSGSSELHRTLQALSKVELHRHLEGSLRLSTLAKIAREYNIEVPGYEVEDFYHLVQMTPDDPPTSASYLSKFKMLRNFYRSDEIIRQVAYEAVADAAADNITYFELRFTPIALAGRNKYPLEDVIRWVIDSVNQAQQDHDILVRLIVSMNRHESVEIGSQFVDLAIKYQDQGIVAVDLAGAEAQFPATPFTQVFRKAKDAGLAVTIHAGEWSGADNVIEAIESLGASRIGHGVRAIEKPSAIALAKERGTTFEICPSSNMQSGVFASWDTHPLLRMYEAGLNTTINTDNTLVSAITLTEEIERTIQHLSFNIDDVKQQTLNAARSAFLPEAEREALVQRLLTEFYPDQEKTTASH